MKQFWLSLLFIGFASPPVGASPCFQKIRDQVLNGEFLVPEDILTPLGLTQAEFKNLPREDETFTRSLETDVNSHLDYAFFLRTKTHKLDTKYVFSSPQIAQSDSAFNFSVKWLIADSSGRPVSIHQVDLSYKEDGCNPKVRSSMMAKYERLPGGKYKISTSRMLGDMVPKHDTVITDEDLVYNERLFAEANTVEELLHSPFLGKDFQIQTLDEDFPIYKITTRQAAPRLHLNPITGKTEHLKGVALELPSMGFTSYVYQSADTSYRLLGAESSAGVQQYAEIIPQGLWLQSRLLKSKGRAEQTVTGFRATDFTSNQLRYEISGKGPVPKLFNIEQYAEVGPPKIQGDRWTIEVLSRTPEMPVAIPWDIPTRKEDEPYLKGSKYIQLEEIAPIADQVRPLIKGMDRLSASVVILNHLKRLLTYDFCSVKDDYVTFRTTRELLDSGKGVCQHFAALFTAIARSLGIPSRIVYGFMLAPGEAILHAWVEVKVNPNTWWPLESQHQSSFLDVRSFVPVGQHLEYDISAESPNEDLQAAFKIVSQERAQWKNTTFRKLPLRKSPSNEVDCPSILAQPSIKYRPFAPGRSAND